MERKKMSYTSYEHVVLFAVALRSNAGHDLLILEVSRSRTTTHHSRQGSSGRVTSSSQRSLIDNTHNIYNRQTSMPPSGIRTHDLSRRAAADIRLTLWSPQTARPLGPAHKHVGKGKVTPLQARLWPRGWQRYSSTLPRPRRQKAVNGQQHAPAALYTREGHGTHCTRGWVGPRTGLYGRKISPPPGFDPRTVQPVVSRYTD